MSEHRDNEGLQSYFQWHNIRSPTLESNISRTHVEPRHAPELNVSNSRMNPEQAPERQENQYLNADGGHRPDERTFAADFTPYKYGFVDSGHGESYDPSRKKKICGLAPHKFYITLAIILTIILAGALGGGLGGGLAHRSSSSSPPSSAANSTAKSTSQAPPAASITVPASLTADAAQSFTQTQVVGPSATLLRDCPAANGSAYGAALGGHAQRFRKLCGTNVLDANGIGDWVNQPTTSLDSCINLCAAFNANNVTEGGGAGGQAPPCTAVCWRNSFDGEQFPGHCFGYTGATKEGGGGFVTLPEGSYCDAAVLLSIH